MPHPHSSSSPVHPTQGSPATGAARNPAPAGAKTPATAPGGTGVSIPVVKKTGATPAPRKRYWTQTRVTFWSIVVTCLLTGVLALPEVRHTIVSIARWVSMHMHTEDVPLRTDVFEQDKATGPVTVFVYDEHGFPIPDASLLIADDEKPRCSTSGRHTCEAAVRTRRIWVLAASGKILGWFLCPVAGNVRVFVAL